jgi:beta-lactamase class A
MPLNNKYFLTTVFVLTASFLFAAGFFIGKKINSKPVENSDGQAREIRQSGYKFINPLLECEVDNSSSILKSAELKIKKTIQDDIIDKNPDAEVALYYRDLKNGPAFGINEQSQYSPASLLKVPLMIAYYKYSESEPDIFKKEILFDEASPEFSQNFKPGKNIELGKSYTVEQLIESMIRYSDNEATNLLFQNINSNNLNSIFSDLGISAPDMYNPDNSISVKDYASFFRILYNASYLNRIASEQTLNLLSMVEYKDGLAAGVPAEMMIAHKFGERESRAENGQIIRQLHDCGIVYHPSRPYLLCVMTRGKNFDNLTNIVSGVSNIIYQEINNK